MKSSDAHADAHAFGEPVTFLEAFDSYASKACEELGRFIATHHFGSDLAPEYLTQRRETLAAVAASWVKLRESRLVRDAGFHLPTARRLMAGEVAALDKRASLRLCGETTAEEHLEILARLRHAQAELDAMHRCLAWLNGAG